MLDQILGPLCIIDFSAIELYIMEKVRIKYLSRIMFMNSQVAAKEIQQWCG